MELTAPGQGDLLVSAEGVIDHHSGQLLRHVTSPIARDQGTGNANTDGRIKKIVAIKTFTPQRDKQITRLQRAAIGADVFKRPSQGRWISRARCAAAPEHPTSGPDPAGKARGSWVGQVPKNHALANLG